MLSTRQYLKQLDKRTLKKLFELAELSEEEYWLVTYAFIERRMRENTCIKLGIGTNKYHTMLNQALIKIEFVIRQLDKVRTL